MDVLTLILRTVRNAIEQTGAPPDALQDALAEAERTLRSSLGGGAHVISRVQQVSTKARIATLAESGLAATQISERLGVSDRYVYRVLSQLRQVSTPD
jgi:hypothetical protein